MELYNYTMPMNKKQKIQSALKILPPLKKITKKEMPIVLKGYDDITDEEIQQAWKQDKPLILSLYLGAKCNLRCIYCFTRGGISTKNNLTEREYKKIIDEAFRLKIKRVIFSGRGEPLLYLPLLKRLLKYIKEKGGWNIIVTNATLITPKIAKDLYNLNCSVMTKINSFNPEIQNKLAGLSDAAPKIYRGVRYLMEAGFNKIFPTRLAIDNIICKLNYKEISFMAHYFRNHNIQYKMKKILWAGRAANNIDKLRITNEELKKEAPKNAIRHWSKNPYLAGGKCIVDTIIILVNERGDVMPCWGRENLTVGNIRSSSLKNLWHNSNLVQLREQHRKIIELVKKKRIPPRECAGRYYNKKILKNKGIDISQL